MGKKSDLYFDSKKNIDNRYIWLIKNQYVNNGFIFYHSKCGKPKSHIINEFVDKLSIRYLTFYETVVFENKNQEFIKKSISLKKFNKYFSRSIKHNSKYNNVFYSVEGSVPISLDRIEPSYFYKKLIANNDVIFEKYFQLIENWIIDSENYDHLWRFLTFSKDHYKGMTIWEFIRYGSPSTVNKLLNKIVNTTNRLLNKFDNDFKASYSCILKCLSEYTFINDTKEYLHFDLSLCKNIAIMTLIDYHYAFDIVRYGPYEDRTTYLNSEDESTAIAIYKFFEYYNININDINQLKYVDYQTYINLCEFYKNKDVMNLMVL